MDSATLGTPAPARPRRRPPPSRAWHLVDLAARAWHAWSDRRGPIVEVHRADCRRPGCGAMFDNLDDVLATRMLAMHDETEHRGAAR